MSRYIFQEFHRKSAFEDLARATGTEQIIEEYQSRGLTFFHLPNIPIAPPTGYNRDFATVPGQEEGDLHIREDTLEKYGLSWESGFVWQLLHELGHYESYSRRLNHRCELLAWYFAGDMYDRALGSELPDWWLRVRGKTLATYGMEWDEEVARNCSLSPCSHRRI
jgi:hypothetical protein